LQQKNWQIQQSQQQAKENLHTGRACAGIRKMPVTGQTNTSLGMKASHRQS
jgi:hypothetical protein